MNLLERTWPDTPEISLWLHQPREDLVAESRSHDDSDSSSFVQDVGPFTQYTRQITRMSPDSSGRVTWHETISYALIIPWFGWIFSPLIRRHLRQRRPGSEHFHRAFWLPPDRLNARHVHVLGLLGAASLMSAFVNTLFTQTVAFAGDDLGVGDWGRGVAGTIVRVGIIFGFPAAILADRIGRRRVIVILAWAAPLIASLGALAPNFAFLVATQTLSRPLGLALDLLVAVVATEEMPRSSRAYAVSILAMANGLGASVQSWLFHSLISDLKGGAWSMWCLSSGCLPHSTSHVAFQKPNDSNAACRIDAPRCEHLRRIVDASQFK